MTWAQGNGLRDSLRNLLASRKSRVLSGEKKTTANGAMHLPRGVVQRLDRGDEAREVSVLHGVVWVTTTSEEGDIVLQAGASFFPRGRFPVLVEALTEEASLLICR